MKSGMRVTNCSSQFVVSVFFRVFVCAMMQRGGGKWVISYLNIRCCATVLMMLSAGPYLRPEAR